MRWRRGHRGPPVRLREVLGVVAVALVGVLAIVFLANRPGPEVSAVIAYVPYWDQQRAFADLWAHVGTFDQVSPWWYAPRDDGGAGPQDATVVVDHGAVAALQAQGIKVVPTVADHRDGVWVPEAAARVLRDARLRAAHVDAVARLVRDNGYDGVEIDYEQLPVGSRDDLSAFVRQLAEVLHPEGKLLAVTVQPRAPGDGSADLVAMGGHIDQLRVMAYDRHWDGSGPGPVAPLPWVRSVLAWATGLTPRAQVILGCPLYGYDWGAVGTGHDGHDGTSTELTARARRFDVPIEWDPTAFAPWYTYDTGGRRHEVWLENERSVRAKVRLAADAGIGGVAFWRLGGVDPALLTAIAQRPHRWPEDVP